MVYLSEGVIEQIEETVQEPLEEWIEDREEECEQQEWRASDKTREQLRG